MLWQHSLGRQVLAQRSRGAPKPFPFSLGQTLQVRDQTPVRATLANPVDVLPTKTSPQWRRRANALLLRHRTTWAELLAPSHESLKVPRPTQAQQQRPKSSPSGSYAFREKPIWGPNVHSMQPQRHSTTKEVRQARVRTMLGVLFFPVTVFVWLRKGIVPATTRWWPKPVAMIVTILGSAIAAIMWVLVRFSIALLIGIN